MKATLAPRLVVALTLLAGCENQRSSVLEYSMVGFQAQAPVSLRGDEVHVGTHCLRRANPTVDKAVWALSQTAPGFEGIQLPHPAIYPQVALDHALLSAGSEYDALVDASISYTRNGGFAVKECYTVEGVPAKLAGIESRRRPDIPLQPGVTGEACLYMLGFLAPGIDVARDGEPLGRLKSGQLACTKLEAGTHLFELTDDNNRIYRVDVPANERVVLHVERIPDPHGSTWPSLHEVNAEELAEVANQIKQKSW